MKLTINVAAFTSFLASFLLPFVVVNDATLAPLLYVSGWTMLISFALLCIVPLTEMWLGKPGATGFDALPRRKDKDIADERLA